MPFNPNKGLKKTILLRINSYIRKQPIPVKTTMVTNFNKIGIFKGNINRADAYRTSIWIMYTG